jgi:hypothetical protein
MGFFRDIAALQRVGAEASRNWDPATQLAQAQRAMADANSNLTVMTARLNSTTVATGTAGTATVTAASQTGQYFNMQPMVRLDLLVQADGMPMPVTIIELVPQLHLHRVAPGANLAVRVGQAPGDVVVDWAAVN